MNTDVNKKELCSKSEFSLSSKTRKIDNSINLNYNAKYLKNGSFQLIIINKINLNKTGFLECSYLDLNGKNKKKLILFQNIYIKF